MSIRSRQLCTLFVALSMWIPSGVYGYTQFDTSLSVTETHTNNALLLPTPFHFSEWITDISPTVALSMGHLKDARKGALNAAYQFQGLLYKNNTQSDITYHRGFLHYAKSAPRLFSSHMGMDFAFDSSYTQQILSPQNQVSNTLQSNTQTTDTIIYQLGPTFYHSLGSRLNHRVDIRYAQTHYVSNPLPHGDDWMVNGSIQTGKFWQRFKSSINYQYRDTRQSDQSGLKTLSISGLLNYEVTKRFYLTAQIGYENIDNQNSQTTVDPTREGLAWLAGFAYRPTLRTALSYQQGQRPYGRTMGLDASWVLKRHQLLVNYQEDVTNTVRQEINAVGQSNLNNLTPQPTQFISSFTQAVLVQKTWEGNYVYQFNRTTLRLQGFYIKNNMLDTSLDQTGKGANLSWQRKLNPELDCAITVGKLNQQFFDLTRDKRWSLQGDLNWHLARRWVVTGAYQVFTNHSELFLRNVSENRAMVSVKAVV